MDKVPFSLVLSNDKSTLEIQLREAVLSYSGEQMSELIQALAKIWTGMNPPFSENVQGGVHIPEKIIDADHYQVYQDPKTGEAQIYFRVLGFSWICMRLLKPDALRLSETLSPPSGSPSGVSHN